MDRDVLVSPFLPFLPRLTGTTATGSTSSLAATFIVQYRQTE